MAKKKKISFDDSTNNENSSAKTQEVSITAAASETSTQGIDLEKFQEFESEAHCVLNGHVPIFDHTDTDNDSQNESTRETQLNHIDAAGDKHAIEKKNENNSEVENMDVSQVEIEKPVDNDVSNSSSRRGSFNTEDLSFSLDSDSSLTNNSQENEKVVIDGIELEKSFAYTVKATRMFSIELLCDVYVQLSRTVGQYARIYDRKSLPKVN